MLLLSDGQSYSIRNRRREGSFQDLVFLAGTKAALKVRTAVAQMEADNFGDHKSVGGGVWERRINFEKGYRVYFAKDGNELVLLFCGGTKDRQQIDIDKAKWYWSKYKKRRAQEKKEEKAKARDRLKKKRRRK